MKYQKIFYSHCHARGSKVVHWRCNTSSYYATHGTLELADLRYIMLHCITYLSSSPKYMPSCISCNGSCEMFRELQRLCRHSRQQHAPECQCSLHNITHTYIADQRLVARQTSKHRKLHFSYLVAVFTLTMPFQQIKLPAAGINSKIRESVSQSVNQSINQIQPSDSTFSRITLVLVKLCLKVDKSTASTKWVNKAPNVECITKWLSSNRWP